MADPPGAEAETSEEFHQIAGPGGVAGWILRLLRAYQVPAIALGEKRIFRVLLHGDEFRLPIAEGKDAIGFYTTRFVASRSKQDAEARARDGVLNDWNGLSLMSHFSGTESPRIAVEEACTIEERVWLRPRQGFTFYSDEE